MSITRIHELKKSILDVIQDNNYDIEDLNKFLEPVSNYVANQIFIENLREIISVILEDRDGNNTFTIKDLELLGKDIIGITSIVSGLLLIIGLIPELKLQYDAGFTEEILFKLFSYIFLVIVPKETGHPWTFEEKEAVVRLIVTIYQLIMSSQVTKDLISKIAEWFKKKGWCQCLSNTNTEEEKIQVVQKHMPLIKAEIRSRVQFTKTHNRMQDEIEELKKQLCDLDNKTKALENK